MPSLSADTVCLLIFSVLVTAFVMALVIAVCRSRKTADPADGAAEPSPEPEEDLDALPDGDWTPPEPVAFPARVVHMRVVTGNVGSHKRPKTGMSFLVTFLTDDGISAEYPVPESLYVTLDVDQTGTLVILNDGFFDFGAGETCDEEADAAFPEAFGVPDGGQESAD